MTPDGIIVQAALWFAVACFGLAQLICLYRVATSRVITDRILALDTMAVNMIALLALFGIAQGTGIYFEAAMLFALTGFVSTVAYCRFILRGDIVE